MKEQDFDQTLNIKTTEEQKGFNQSFHYHRYEPTPYHALELLFDQYQLVSGDRIVDFGCGKGRLNFYLHNRFDATVVGIEMNHSVYLQALDNRMTYLKKGKRRKDNLYFYNCLAEDYEIHPLDNRFYFFNPFSIQIFMTIINNILHSTEESAREVELVLYYCTEDYMHFLERHPCFELKAEIPLPDLYEKNSYERFLIYQLVN